MQSAKTEVQEKARELYRSRQEAKAQGLVVRIRERAMRSPQEQLAVLDKRLGKDKGAKRERARLQAMLDAAANPKRKKNKSSKKKGSNLLATSEKGAQG